MKKVSQHTKLDQSTIVYPGYESPQKILPFQKKHMTNEDYEFQQDLKSKTNEEFNKKNRQPKEPINFQYPDLSPEQLKYRKLTDQERQNIKEEWDDDYKRQMDYNRWNKNYQYDETRFRYHDTHQLNKDIPENVKQKVLDKYKELQKVAKEFQIRYFEANQFASETPEMSYQGTYADLFRNFAAFLIAAIKKEIGALFGLSGNKSKSGRYSYDTQLLVEFLTKGLNIFNLNPFNVPQKINEMDNAIHYMKNIMEKYDRSKKLFSKLPAQVNTEVKSYLSKKYNKDFLKWMDEYFANDKEELMKDAVTIILEKHRGGNTFSLEDLADFKTYKSIYEGTSATTTTSLKTYLRNQHEDKIKKDLKEEFDKRLTVKVNNLYHFLQGIINTTKPEENKNIDGLVKYLYKNYQMDLRSVLNFVDQEIKKENTKDQITEAKIIKRLEKLSQQKYEGTFDQFKQLFFKNFDDNIGELKANVRDYYKSSQIDQYINNFLETLRFNPETKKIDPNPSKNYQINLDLFSTKTEKDLDNLVNQFIKDIVVKSLPNFKTNAHYQGMKEYQDLPNFSGLKDFVEESGRLSIGDIVNQVHKNIEFVPKEFILNLVKTNMRGDFKFANPDNSLNGNRVFSMLSGMQGTSPQTVMKILMDLLKRSGKFNPNSFTNVFMNHWSDFMAVLGRRLKSREFNTKTDEETLQIFSHILRNTDTIQRDLDNFGEFADFLHNSASDIKPKDLLTIFSNKNFSTYLKSGITKKLFKIYAEIKSMGGLAGINKEYGSVLQELKNGGYISKDLEKNIRYVSKVFESGEIINPASPEFKKIFEIISSLETDLQTMEMSDALKQLITDYTPKDKKLFDLNVSVNDDLRFRVLPDKDPRMLRVGIESNCCQRIGGAGETAARDSFVNPLAGVVILEGKNEEGKWVLLGQSYFHYVPKTNSFILDNIEHNYENTNKLKRKFGDDAFSVAYAYLAKYIKEKFHITDFLAGTGYSKLDTTDFGRTKLRGGDPRFFDPKALKGTGGRGFYSDFSPNNAMDLLKPKIKNLDSKISELTGKKNDIVEAFEKVLGRIIRTAMVI